MLLPNPDPIHPLPIYKPPLPFPNPHIIPAHHPLAHLPLRVERPVLEPVAALPPHPLVRVPVLVPELHRDRGVPEREQFLAQPVGALPLPFRRQERDDCCVPLQEGGAVAPDGVGCVGVGYFLGVSVLGQGG